MNIDNIVNLLVGSNIMIPKSVAFRKDVYEETKTLFGVLFTECVMVTIKEPLIKCFHCPLSDVFSRTENYDFHLNRRFLTECGCAIDGKTIGKLMKEYLMDMSVPEIQYECVCSPAMASAARSEVAMLINRINFSDCLRESMVN